MSRRNFRRFRRDVPLIRGSRRPTDKELIYISQTFTSSNTVTTMKTATFPCTIVGLRWNFAGIHTFTTGNSIVNWIIVIVRDGTLTFMDADAGFGSTTKQVEGQTKTMRKMQQGDLLQFITISSNANAGTINGVVQFFCKS